MRKVSKKLVGISIAVLIFVIALIIAVPKITTAIKLSKITDPEVLKAITYGELEDEDYETQSENVEFSAFFPKDLDGDGYAERVKGYYGIGGSQGELYVEFKVNKERIFQKWPDYFES